MPRRSNDGRMAKAPRGAGHPGADRGHAATGETALLARFGAEPELLRQHRALRDPHHLPARGCFQRAAAATRGAPATAASGPRHPAPGRAAARGRRTAGGLRALVDTAGAARCARGGRPAGLLLWRPDLHLRRHLSRGGERVGALQRLHGRRADQGVRRPRHQRGHHLEPLLRPCPGVHVRPGGQHPGHPRLRVGADDHPRGPRRGQRRQLSGGRMSATRKT